MIYTHLYECYNLNRGLYILKKIADMPEASNFITFAIGPLSSCCESASDFIDLASFLVENKQKEKAIKVASNILSTNRTEGYEKFDYIYGRLCSIGMQDLANKFELYIHGGSIDNG